MDAINISGVESDWMSGFRGNVLKGQEVVGHLRGASHLTGSVETQHQQIQHQAVELYDERGELKTADDSVRVGVVHVLQVKIVMK